MTTLVVCSAEVVAACTTWGWRAPAPTRALPRERSAPVLYVALGDSTVEGVGASRPELNYVSRLGDRLHAVYPTVRVENLGVAGATSADVRGHQLPRALELAPHLVTLSVGPNDITRRVPLKRFETNIDAIFKTLMEETRAVVVVNLLPDLAVTRRFRGTSEEARVGRLSAEFNDVLRRRARGRGVDLVDLFTASREEVPNRPELLARDGYHPSDSGYALWAELMWSGIERWITAR